MIYIIWSFQVDSSQISAFEKMYGANGEWALLFQQSPDYLGTLLLKKDVLGTYLTIDRWTNLEAFENFTSTYSKVYHELDKMCEKLTLSEQKLGIFEVIE